MEKVSWKGGALLAPLPAVMVSCGSLEKPNVMTVAWTGIINTQPSKTYISVRKSRYSYDLIKNSGSFVINLVPSTLVKACDFCGVRSGRDLDKFKDKKVRIYGEFYKVKGWKLPLLIVKTVRAAE